MELTAIPKYLQGLLSDPALMFVRADTVITGNTVSGTISAFTDPSHGTTPVFFSSDTELDTTGTMSFVTVTELAHLWRSILADPYARIHLDLRPMVVLSVESGLALGNLKVEISGPELTIPLAVDMLTMTNVDYDFHDQTTRRGMSGVQVNFVISRSDGNTLMPVAQPAPAVQVASTPSTSTGNSKLVQQLAALDACGVGETYEARTIQPLPEDVEARESRKKEISDRLNRMVDADVATMVQTGKIPDSPVNTIMGTQDPIRAQLTPTNLSQHDNFYIDMTSGVGEVPPMPLPKPAQSTQPADTEKDQVDSEVVFGE